MVVPNENNMFEDFPDVVGVYDLRTMLGGISKKLVYRILQDSIIPSVRIGREYKIAKLDVVNYILRRNQRDDL